MTQFTAEHANTILSLIGHVNVSELRDRAAMSAVAALMSAAEGGDENRVVDLYVRYRPNDNAAYVTMIKAIRCVTGMGLKEAKDMVDRLNPRKEIGVFGPISSGPAHEVASFDGYLDVVTIVER